MNRFPVEITFEGVKYTFQISRLGPSLLELAIADKKPLVILMCGPFANWWLLDLRCFSCLVASSQRPGRTVLFFDIWLILVDFHYREIQSVCTPSI